MAIVFLCPADDTPSGGIKVIYRHSEMLNSNGVESYIFHPHNPQFSCTWFSHSAVHHDGWSLNPGRDFLIVPEIWAAQFGKRYMELGFKYAIYVQNGYATHQNFSDDTSRVYEKADLLLSVSDDTSNMLSIAYPNIHVEKIMRLFSSVDTIFSAASPKEKMIAYMPRKHPKHAERICFYLRNYLPKAWSIVRIHNVPEIEVATILARSSIFMSLSDLEGLGVPPLEAAVSGNVVVGYTGEGGKEYFHKPIFREVATGDLSNYVKAIQLAISDVEGGVTLSKEFSDQVTKLKISFSKENELSHLLRFAAAVDNIMKHNQAISEAESNEKSGDVHPRFVKKRLYLSLIRDRIDRFCLPIYFMRKKYRAIFRR